MRRFLHPQVCTAILLGLGLVFGAPARSGAVCVGDCDNGSDVTVDEIITLVNVALGTSDPSACPSGLPPDTGIDIAVIIQAVNNALGAQPLHAEGTCLRPGQTESLVACADGTPVRVFLCVDPSRCLHDPSALDLVADGTVQGGAFVLTSCSVARLPLVIEAEPDPGTTYRIIDFALVVAEGSASLVARRHAALDNLTLSPVTEAAARLLDENGLQNFDAMGVQQVTVAVEQAGAAIQFGGLDAATAATLATDTTRNDATVQTVIVENNLSMPTPTPVPVPTPTPPEPGLHVTKTEDSNDGVCDADCSLREAIAAAEANPGPDVINVPAGLYKLTNTDLGTFSTDLRLHSDVTIAGAGQDQTIIDGNHTHNVFTLYDGAVVGLSDLTVQNGLNGDPGAGILNYGTLTLERVMVADNTNGSTEGGGIWNNSTAVLTIRDSVITRNNGYNSGGGIQNGGSLTISNSTISHNSAFRGGGINSFVPFLIENSTISDNNANREGGGLLVRGATLNNVTITDNRGAPGGISGGPVTASNTLIAGNDGDNSCDGVVDSGYNLCTTDARLGPLADNGGPTLTHALLPDSPAIDTGNPAPPGSGPGTCAATDERGVARPQGNACDIGAFESSFIKQTPTPTQTPTQTPSPTATRTPTATAASDPLCAMCCNFSAHGCPQGGCGACDMNGDGQVTVNELIGVCPNGLPPGCFN